MSDLTNNCGSSHNLDCKSILSAMIYDSKCVRCKKIKYVIALRRKGLAGASPEEAESADALAGKLVAQYKLTRGETFDREYRTQEIETLIQTSRVQARESKRRRNRMEVSI